MMTSRMRSDQLASAQSVFRKKMREHGYQRLQEWIPATAAMKLSQLCEVWGISRREAIEGLIDAANSGQIKLKGKQDDDRQ
jgi:hypothetical protein